MQKFLAGATLACALCFAGTNARAQLDKPTKQVLLESKFIEVYGEYRNFINWTDVSGNDPSVVKHEASSSAGGLGLNVGLQIGSLPLWAQAGGYYSGGLSTNTTLENGDRIHGKVKNYGGGAGLRLVPLTTARLAMFLWAMGYYDRNDGDFETFDEDGSTRSENRIHAGWMGDYGIGAMYLIDEVVGLDFGASYSGIFDKKNADENIRLRIGFILNPPKPFNF